MARKATLRQRRDPKHENKRETNPSRPVADQDQIRTKPFVAPRLLLLSVVSILVLTFYVIISPSPPQQPTQQGEAALNEDYGVGEAALNEDYAVGEADVVWHRIGRRACGIQYAPGFLSSAEVEHILRLVDRSGGCVHS